MNGQQCVHNHRLWRFIPASQRRSNPRHAVCLSRFEDFKTSIEPECCDESTCSWARRRAAVTNDDAGVGCVFEHLHLDEIIWGEVQRLGGQKGGSAMASTFFSRLCALSGSHTQAGSAFLGLRCAVLTLILWSIQSDWHFGRFRRQRSLWLPSGNSRAWLGARAAAAKFGASQARRLLRQFQSSPLERVSEFVINFRTRLLLLLPASAVQYLRFNMQNKSARGPAKRCSPCSSCSSLTKLTGAPLSQISPFLPQTDFSTPHSPPLSCTTHSTCSVHG